MATFELPTRRFICAAGLAFAIGLAPTAWVLGGADHANRVLADPASCQVNSATASAQITCSPSDPSGNGGSGPSEQQLTEQNQGNNHTGGHG